MRRHVIRLAVLAALVLGASAAIARSTGAPRGATGAPAVGIVVAEQNCSFCHDGAFNDPSGSVEILDLPEKFDLNTDYVLRVRVSHTWNPIPPDPVRWGFELTAARADSGTGYGTIIPGTDSQLSTSGAGGMPAHATRQYVTHTSGGTHTGDSGPVEWTITWRSPGYPTGKVLFFAAGNSADGNGSSSGDWIFTTSTSMEFVNVSVGDGPVARTELARPTPHPARGGCQIRFALARAGDADLSIFDAQGRRVRGLIRGEQPAGPGLARWDGQDDGGRPVQAGVYFARLMAPGESSPQIQKVVLSR